MTHPQPRTCHGDREAGAVQGRGADIAGSITRIAAELEDAIDSPVILPELRGGAVLDATEAIAELAGRTASRMTTESSAETRHRLAGVMSELQRLALDVHLQGMSRTSARLSEGSRALARLRRTDGTSELLQDVCAEIVRGGGFDRVVLSRVSGASWNPWLAHSTATDALDQWFPSWVGSSIDIDARAPEHTTLARRRAVLVQDTETAPVYRPIVIDAGQSRSYVVAPLISQGAVIGFLHADHVADERRTDVVDRDALWSFASGLGFLYERATLQDTLRRHRHQARDVFAAVAESVLAFAEQEAVGDAAGAPLSGPPRRDGGTASSLTKREGEVLRLMADGLTNAAIADRLVLSSDTIKSHVKHILRKLGVNNRSQAVTAYLSA